MDRAKFVTCLCEYCLNVELKLRVINKTANKNNMNIGIMDKYQINILSMCEKTVNEVYYQKKCIERNCKKCGVNKVKEKLMPLIENANVKDSTGNISKLKVLIDKSGTLEDCVGELLIEVSCLSMHMFSAQWQYNQFKEIKNNVPENWLVSRFCTKLSLHKSR